MYYTIGIIIMSRELINRFNSKQFVDYELRQGLNINSVEQILYDQSAFAKRITPEATLIRDNVILSQNSLELGGESFTNYYDLVFDPVDPTLGTVVESSSHPYFLRRTIINNPTLISSINAGFFFLCDESRYQPQDPTYNFCMRAGQVIGLPATNRPAVYISDGILHAKNIKAKGIININNQSFQWVGSKTEHSIDEPSVVLYNSASCRIQHIPTVKTGTKRILDEDTNFTPENPHAIDIVVRTDQKGNLRVQDITRGGKTNLFSGNFILHVLDIDIGQILPGDIVIPDLLDGIKLSSVDSAVTIGPSIFDFENMHDSEINYDCSLGSNPPFTERRMARSIIYMDKQDKLHFGLFDGAPKAQYFQGVTPQEVFNILRGNQIKWAYFLDPGQSSKLALRKDGQVFVYGNTHYLRWPKKSNHPFLWTPLNGRMITSSISLYQKG